ncbi:cullin-1-like [Magnolia sinica]|uniref:cullin-1-like n=1 Tax=Magnolia sinica TaxID=86752 RepID=UPI002657F0C7|nr:cullin-1-like [Magnolia sinica]XP_058082249.1 cullin-1-like [Magnolia sinica]
MDPWDIIKEIFAKGKEIMVANPEMKFTSKEYMRFYGSVFTLCTKPGIHFESQIVFDKFKEFMEECITYMVLPSLKEKHDDNMLRELVKMWSNYRVMVKWQSRFFGYLDRFYVPRTKHASIYETGICCFRDLVCRDLNAKFRDAVISLINQERNGRQIDQGLVKNVLDFFVDISKGCSYPKKNMDIYKDFELAMLEDTTAYYSRKASEWISVHSLMEYMLKVEQCLNQERERVSHYLQPSSQEKLLKVVEQELVVVPAAELRKKVQSQEHVLLEELLPRWESLALQ